MKPVKTYEEFLNEGFVPKNDKFLDKLQKSGKRINFCIGSSGWITDSNDIDEKYLEDKMSHLIRHEFYDANFQFNYLDTKEKNEHREWFEKNIIHPSLKNLDEFANTYLEDGGLSETESSWQKPDGQIYIRIKDKLNTRDIINNFFLGPFKFTKSIKTSEVSEKLRYEYILYRWQYGGENVDIVNYEYSGTYAFDKTIKRK
jgi:hypothetical protein